MRPSLGATVVLSSLLGTEFLFAAGAAATSPRGRAAEPSRPFTVYVGTYTWGEKVDPGIYIFELEAVNISTNQVAKKSGMVGVVE